MAGWAVMPDISEFLVCVGVNGMVFNIKEEIDALTLNENYRPLLEIDS